MMIAPTASDPVALPYDGVPSVEASQDKVTRPSPPTSRESPRFRGHRRTDSDVRIQRTSSGRRVKRSTHDERRSATASKEATKASDSNSNSSSNSSSAGKHASDEKAASGHRRTPSRGGSEGGDRRHRRAASPGSVCSSASRRNSRSSRARTGTMRRRLSDASVKSNNPYLHATDAGEEESVRSGRVRTGPMRRRFSDASVRSNNPYLHATEAAEDESIVSNTLSSMMMQHNDPKSDNSTTPRTVGRKVQSHSHASTASSRNPHSSDKSSHGRSTHRRLAQSKSSHCRSTNSRSTHSKSTHSRSVQSRPATRDGSRSRSQSRDTRSRSRNKDRASRSKSRDRTGHSRSAATEGQTRSHSVSGDRRGRSQEIHEEARPVRSRSVPGERSASNLVSEGAPSESCNLRRRLKQKQNPRETSAPRRRLKRSNSFGSENPSLRSAGTNLRQHLEATASNSKIRSKASDGRPVLTRMISDITEDTALHKDQRRTRVMTAYRNGDASPQTDDRPARPGLLTRSEAVRGIEVTPPKQMITSSGVEGGPLSSILGDMKANATGTEHGHVVQHKADKEWLNCRSTQQDAILMAVKREQWAKDECGDSRNQAENHKDKHPRSNPLSNVFTAISKAAKGSLTVVARDTKRPTKTVETEKQGVVTLKASHTIDEITKMTGSSGLTSSVRTGATAPSSDNSIEDDFSIPSETVRKAHAQQQLARMNLGGADRPYMIAPMVMVGQATSGGNAGNWDVH